MQEFPTGTCSIVCIIDTLSGAAGKYFLFLDGYWRGFPRPVCVCCVSWGEFWLLSACTCQGGHTQLAWEKELVASGNVQIHLCEMQKNGGVWSPPVLAYMRPHPHQRPRGAGCMARPLREGLLALSLPSKEEGSLYISG